VEDALRENPQTADDDVSPWQVKLTCGKVLVVSVETDRKTKKTKYDVYAKLPAAAIATKSEEIDILFGTGRGLSSTHSIQTSSVSSPNRWSRRSG
jgi:hypothetical protein